MGTLLSPAIYLLLILLGVINASAFAYTVAAADTQTLFALREQDIKPQAVMSVPDSALDSKAQTYIRILPKKILPASASDTLSADEAKQNPAVNGRQGNIQRLEEIRVLDQVAPEDYVAPKLAPMLAFRAKLDRQRPMTPQEVTQAALCFIGLCKIDTSKELRIDDRNEARAKNPPSFAGQP